MFLTRTFGASMGTECVSFFQENTGSGTRYQHNAMLLVSELFVLVLVPSHRKRIYRVLGFASL